MKPNRSSPINWLPVLMYHRVVDRNESADPHALKISIADFKSQIAYLSRHGYRSIALADVPQTLRNGCRHDKVVAITFDDGYLDTLTHALPILSDHGMTATIMLVSDLIGKTNEWDLNESEQVSLLSRSQIVEMRRAEYHFGAHTASHVRLTELNDEAIRCELVSSKHALEELLGEPICSLAFPYGSSTPRISQLAGEAGYTIAVGVDQHERSLLNYTRIDAARYRGATPVWRLKVKGIYQQMRENSWLQFANLCRRAIGGGLRSAARPSRQFTPNQPSVSSIIS